MKAAMARSVIVKGVLSNGSDEHPGIINRAWSNGDTVDGPVGVNVTVFPDCGASLAKTSSAWLSSCFNTVCNEMSPSSASRALSSWELCQPLNSSDRSAWSLLPPVLLSSLKWILPRASSSLPACSC